MHPVPTGGHCAAKLIPGERSDLIGWAGNAKNHTGLFPALRAGRGNLHAIQQSAADHRSGTVCRRCAVYNPEQCNREFADQKAYGHVVYAPATSAAGNVVTYQLAAQAAAAAGMGTACIEIGTANGVLQSPVFALKIVANPMQDDAVKDTDDYKTVAEAVAAANLVNQNLDAILAAPDYAAQAKESENQAGTYKDSARAEC